MAKSLMVVESPAKARTISKYLGRSFVVKATVGHIKDLPTNTLGVDVEDDFKTTMKTIRGKSKVVAALKDAAKGVDAVYLAADPDREGEAIAWHVVEELEKGRKKGEEAPKIYRVLLHEITKTGVKKALSEAGVLDRSRYESQMARRILDRLVGYELSPLLWRKVAKGLSAGRVQSVAVALVVDREREVQAFNPEEYWVFKVTLEGDNPPSFEAKLTKIDGKKASVGTEDIARPIEATLKKATYVVSNIKREEKRRYAPPPFITSTLQQDAFRLFRFSTKKTMMLAQRLYEGVDLGEMGTHGLITYMRSDSLRVSGEAISAVREYIEKNKGAEYVPETPNMFKNKKSAQDAHEAIRPTSMEFDPVHVATTLDKDMGRLYRLIWNRFVASQMAPARFDVTTIQIKADDRWLFETSGKVMLFDGFLTMLRDTDKAEGQELPKLTEGEKLDLKNLETTQNFTQPPARFSEGTLVKEMEKLGIGRPSTYASILSTIQDKSYVGKDSTRFVPTDLGTIVTDLLRESFPDVINVQFTAQMEEELDKIEEGTSNRLELLRNFWGKFAGDLETAKEGMRNIKKDPEKTDVKCTLCEAPMVVRFGKNGSFLACSEFPKCRGTLPFERDEKGTPVPIIEPQIEGEECEKCGSTMILRDGRFGRFWACSTYPVCKGTRPFSTGHPCPEEGCEGTLVEKRSKKGKTFYGCSKYPECKFVAFNPLKSIPCPNCENPFMELKGRGKAKQLHCLKCDHTMDAPEEE